MQRTVTNYHVKWKQKRNENNLCEEYKMFFNREVVKQNVVLWTKSETSTNFVNVVQNIKPINDCRSTCWWEKPCIMQSPDTTVSEQIAKIFTIYPHTYLFIFKYKRYMKRSTARRSSNPAALK